jgi:hypothetical protein
MKNPRDYGLEYEKEAEEKKRSSSFIANEYLLKIYEKKEKK